MFSYSEHDLLLLASQPTSQGPNDLKGLKLYDKCLLRNTKKSVFIMFNKKKNNKKKTQTNYFRYQGN